MLVGTVSRITGEPRLSLLSLLILFAGGAALLWRVDVKEGERMARGLWLILKQHQLNFLPP